MKSPEYPQAGHDWDQERQNELNYLAQILAQAYLGMRRAELNQADYELIKLLVHSQEEWARRDTHAT